MPHNCSLFHHFCFLRFTFNCFVKTGWHEDVERSVKFGGFFEGLVEKP